MQSKPCCSTPYYPDRLPDNPTPDPVDQSNNIARGRPLGSEHYADHAKFDSNPLIHTAHGAIIDSDMASLKSSAFGPVLLQDHILREKITHFDHERIPERAVHARGFGYHGVFIPNKDVNLSNLSNACIFDNTSEEIPIFLRFSTVAGNRGSADCVRDVRGTALRFFTKQGNFDIVGNNCPVFFINDAIKFPDLVHSVKTEPSQGSPQAASAHPTFYDFVSQHPETSHTLLWAMSYRGLPSQFYQMQAFGVHTFALINQNRDKTLCKFIIKPRLGVATFPWSTMQTINGADADFHRKSMMSLLDFNSFSGSSPNIQIPLEYDFTVQILPDEATMLKTYHINVLDSTKYIPEELFPSYNIGTLRFQQNVVNEFSEVEQVAFCPSHIIPGIDFVNDPLLQGRLFSYLDTQLSRLGVNFQQLPINIPRGICPFARTYQQNYVNGAMQARVLASNTAYGPNGLPNDSRLQGAYDQIRHQACPQILPEGHPPVPGLDPFVQSQREQEHQADLKYKTPVHTSHLVHSTFNTLDQLIKDDFGEESIAMFYRASHPLFRDFFTQPRAYWLSLSHVERSQLAHALIFELSQFPDRHDLHCTFIHRILCHIDSTLAQTVARALDIEIDSERAEKYRSEWFQSLEPYYSKYSQNFFESTCPDSHKSTSCLDRNEFYVMLSMSPSLSISSHIYHEKAELLSCQDRLLWNIQHYLKKVHPHLAATDDKGDLCTIYPFDKLQQTFPVAAQFVLDHVKTIDSLQKNINDSKTTQKSENCYLGTAPPSLAYRKALVVIDKGSNVEQICAIYTMIRERCCMFVDLATSEMPMSSQLKDIHRQISQKLNMSIPILNSNTLSSVHYHCIVIPSGSTSWVTDCPIVSNLVREMYNAGKVIIDLSHLVDATPANDVNDTMTEMCMTSKSMLFSLCQIKEAYCRLELFKQRDPESCCAESDPLCICGASSFASVHSLCKCNGIVRLRTQYDNNLKLLLSDIFDVLVAQDLYSKRQVETIPLASVSRNACSKKPTNRLPTSTPGGGVSNPASPSTSTMDGSTCNIH